MIKESIPIVKSDVIVFKKKLKNELILRTKYSLDRSNFKLNACAKAFLNYAMVRIHAKI